MYFGRAFDPLIVLLARDTDERRAEVMLTVDNMLTILSFGLGCFGIGFALGLAIGKLSRSKSK